MKIDGQCLCGYISYEANVDRDRVMICHCTDCQASSASAFRTGVMVRKDNFRLLTGQPKIFVKTAQSGAKRALAFCPECGTSLYGSDVVEPKSYSLRIGTARQRHQLVPKKQIWHYSALSWVAEIEQIEKFELQPSVRA